MVRNTHGVITYFTFPSLFPMQYRPLGSTAPRIFVNGNGGIFSLDLEREMDLFPAASNADGNAYVRFQLEGSNWICRSVRTLVALAWLPGATLASLGLDDTFKLKSRKPTGCFLHVVNRNGNKYDNSVPNLKLCNDDGVEVVFPVVPDSPPQQPPAVPPQLQVEGAAPAEQQQQQQGLDLVDFGPWAALAKAAVMDAVIFAEQYAAALASPGNEVTLSRPGTTAPYPEEDDTVAPQAASKKRRWSSVSSAGASPATSVLPTKPASRRRKAVDK